jgi:hypothetical protein
LKHRIFSFATVVTAIFALAVAVTGCKEDIAIRTNLTPAGDNIGTDTLVIPDTSIILQTVEDDTLQTSTKLATYTVFHALGWLKEPTDSKNPYPSNMDAHVYLQFIPVSTGFSFASTDVVDSAVIILPYGGFSWGDTTVRDRQEVTAYELTDTMSNNSKYYTYTKKDFNASTPVSDPVSFYTGKSGTGVIGDSVTVKGVKVPAHLRIPLKPDFVTKLKNVVALHYSTHDSFLNAIKGFSIQSSKLLNGLAMPYFQIYGSGTSGYYNQCNLMVYAHPNGLNDSVVTYQFPFNSTYTAHYNQITRKYSNNSLFNDPNHPNLMVQNQPGAGIDVRIKDLRLLNALKGNVVVNKVELLFNEVNEFVYPNSTYIRPPRIYPIGIDAVNVRYSVIDRYDSYTSRLSSQTGLDFLDGTPVTNSTTNNTTYSINFPREFQHSIIQQKSELHLRINGTLTYPGAFRLIVGNHSNPNANYRYALKIIYSKQK